tara:strand:+ start:146 stop:391 length:246 start_codon:yes stop_codon:yes gene_type:complete
MGTKTISIMDDVYELLARHKRAGESFSDEIRREFAKKGNIMEFAGAWKGLVSDEEAEQMKKRIREIRSKIGSDILKRVARS